MIEFYIILLVIFILYFEKFVFGRSLFMVCNFRWNLFKDFIRIVLFFVLRYKKVKKKIKKLNKIF